MSARDLLFPIHSTKETKKKALKERA